jgi:hypothetical protein
MGGVELVIIQNQTDESAKKYLDVETEIYIK